jgi:putative transposase
MFAPSMRTVCGGQVRDALVLGALVQGREGQRTAEKRAVEKRAVEKLLRKLIRKPSRTPCVMVTDKPGSDGAARTGMGVTFEHRQHMGLNHMGLNNRAENAHLPTRRRKRTMKWIIKRFTSARHLKRLVFIHDPIANLQTVPATPCRHQPGC